MIKNTKSLFFSISHSCVVYPHSSVRIATNEMQTEPVAHMIYLHEITAASAMVFFKLT